MNEEMPEGWAETRFAELIIELRNGISTRPNLEPPGTPILRISAARPGAVALEERRYLPKGDDLLDSYSLREKDLLFTRYNGSIDLLGVCGMVRGLNNAPLLFPDKLMRVRLRNHVVPEFIEAFFQSRSARQAIMALAKSSAGQQGISGSDLKDQIVRLAPLPEQHRIVEKVEALLEQVNRAKERLDRVPLILKRFRQAVLAAACSGELTREWRNDDSGADPPNGWRSCELQELAENTPSAICAGPFGTIFKAHDFRDSGIPIIFLRHVAAGEYRTAKPGFMDTAKWEELFRPYSVWGGELLVAKLGDPPGCCAIYPKGIGPAMVTPDVIKMTVNENFAVPEFLMYYLNSEPARQRAFGVAYGATRPRMNLDIFRCLEVLLPSLAEQKEIVTQVGRLFRLADTIERRVQDSTVRAAKLPQAILAKAFSGELVPTEAELARLEGRTYETAAELLKRVISLGSEAPPIPGKGRGRRPRKAE